jgi:hypothetical protein
MILMWSLKLVFVGVAVGAGEFSEEDAKELAETKQRLARLQLDYKALQSENQILRSRHQANLQPEDS